jgi:hypothetical protein
MVGREPLRKLCFIGSDKSAHFGLTRQRLLTCTGTTEGQSGEACYSSDSS